MALFTTIGTLLGATTAASAGAGIGAFGVGVAATALAGGATAAYMSSSNTAAKSANSARLDAQRAMTMPASPSTVNPADIGPSALELAQKATAERQKAISRSSSIKTNPLGIAGEADVARKTLLGQ